MSGLCTRCGTEIAPGLLRCPACGSLTYAARLQDLAARADQHTRDGQHDQALARWNEALALLPADAAQRPPILQRIQRLESSAPQTAAGTGRRPGGLRGVWVGLATAVLFLLGKVKFLLLGLTKMGTLLSMLAWVGVYWQLYGWKFAVGMVIAIYIHEMGHVAALRHYGIPASAPMFIPGLGAFIRLKAHPPTRTADARVGLAGPIWGTAAALGCLALYLATGDGLYASLTHFGAIINLFNLIPVWQLDGGRGIQALSRPQRWLLLAVVAVSFVAFREGMLLLVGLGVAVQSFLKPPPESDPGTLTRFGLLVVALSWLATVRAAGAPATGF